jgi:two-component system response regulator HydG
LLFVDDDQAMCQTVNAHFRRHGFDVRTYTSGEAALEALGDGPADAVVTDVNMMGLDGLNLCERIQAAHPDTPVILLTAFGSMETAVAALRAGAEDFLSKPVELDQLMVRVRRAVEHRRLAAEVKRLRRSISRTARTSEIIGESPPMRQLFDLLDRVANTEVTVLITGESGTGKELAARALHARSARAAGPFVPINCAAVPETLLEAELFGHAKGAFTDARQARQGLFVRASGGTLLLDEISEMPLDMQVKLLRALQERQVRPVGGEEEISFDVRLLASTNRDLAAEVEAGAFREDLYYRINVVQLEMPPLAARGDDVILLAQHFLEEAAERAGRPVSGLSAEAADKLLAHDWPGNVRELRNAMERAVALTQHEMIVVDDLPAAISSYRPASVPATRTFSTTSERLTLAELERRYVTGVLDEVGGNKTAAARILGFDRRTLYRKLERYASQERSQQEA